MQVLALEYPGTWLDEPDVELRQAISTHLLHLELQLVDVGVSLGLYELDQVRMRVDDEEREERLQRQLQARVGTYMPRSGAEQSRILTWEERQRAQFEAEREAKYASWSRGELPDSYRRRPQFIHAHAFLYAVNTFGSFLREFGKVNGLPDEARAIIEQFEARFSKVREVRNSAQHVEDRAFHRGRRGKRIEPQAGRRLPAGVLSIGNLFDHRLQYTLSDGSQGEIFVSIETAMAVRHALQSVINCFKWSGSPRIGPEW